MPDETRQSNSDHSAAEHFDPWESDHTSLVHVLWDASAKGLDVTKADELAEYIGNSRWMAAVVTFARRDGSIQAVSGASDEQQVAGVPTTTEITGRSWDPKAAGRRAVEGHGDALARLSDERHKP